MSQEFKLPPKKSPYEQGSADAYYGRWNPPEHPDKRKEYVKGYNSEDERKDWGR